MHAKNTPTPVPRTAQRLGVAAPSTGFVAVFVAVFATAADAHSAEQGFILLLPTDVYIAAGVSAFVVTVILIGLLPTGVLDRLFQPLTLARFRVWPGLAQATSLCATLALLFLLYVGLVGPRDPQANLLSLTIWSAWWIGLVAVQGFLGNLWVWINPWAGLIGVLDDALESPKRPQLSDGLGVWPAIAIFLMFILFSIADPAPADPTRLAYLVFGYWFVTFVGMLIFGALPWARHFECFTIFFGLISKLSPFQGGSGIRLGVPGWAFFHDFRYSVSVAVFCLAFLGSGSFDGLNETFWWLAAIDVNPLEFPGRSAIIPQTIAGFVIANLVLGAVFLACVIVGTGLANRGRGSQAATPVRDVVARQALALLPIGFGFHLAHFLPTFMISAQYNIAALSDPFQTGADYLSLGKTGVYVGFLSVPYYVRWIWLSQAGIIVLSHVFAVLIAHKTSRELFRDRPKALLAELPLTVFMVFYTFFGLWLLASPRGV